MMGRSRGDQDVMKRATADTRVNCSTQHSPGGDGGQHQPSRRESALQPRQDDRRREALTFRHPAESCSCFERHMRDEGRRLSRQRRDRGPV
jgi:hypothetical protein